MLAEESAAVWTDPASCTAQKPRRSKVEGGPRGPNSAPLSLLPHPGLQFQVWDPTRLYHAHHFLTPMHNATNKPAKENFMVAFALYLLYSHFNTAQSAVKYDHAAFLLINYQTLLT